MAIIIMTRQIRLGTTSKTGHVAEQMILRYLHHAGFHAQGCRANPNINEKLKSKFDIDIIAWSYKQPQALLYEVVFALQVHWWADVERELGWFVKTTNDRKYLFNVVDHSPANVRPAVLYRISSTYYAVTPRDLGGYEELFALPLVKPALTLSRDGKPYDDVVAYRKLIKDKHEIGGKHDYLTAKRLYTQPSS